MPGEAVCLCVCVCVGVGGGGHVHLQGQDIITELENIRVRRNPREHPMQTASTFCIRGKPRSRQIDDWSRTAKTVNARAETLCVPSVS